MRVSILVVSFILLLTSVGVKEVEAQMSAVAYGQTVTINAHGICYRVYNSSGTTTMVPWNSATEWGNFISYRPGHMSLSNCSVREPSSGEYFSGWNGAPNRYFWNSNGWFLWGINNNTDRTGTFSAGATSATVGGWTYYRGSLMQGSNGYGIYRVSAY